MEAILSKAGCYIAIMVLGFVLRRVGILDEHAFPVISKIVIKVTLPAALISCAVGREIDPSMLILALLGLGSGALYIFLGWLLNRKNNRADQAFDMLNIPGYNIGNFALPFTQSFLGSMGVLTTSLFDVGNALICLGGAYGIASAVQDGKGFDLKRVLKALGTSVPFLAHIITVCMNLARIPIPSVVGELAGIVGGANVFLAMLMIGVGFRLDMDFSQGRRILRILTVRYGVAVVLALAYYFLLPFDLHVRQTLVVLTFAPVASAVPSFTGELGGDSELSCTVNSLSIVISILAILALLMIML